MNKVGTALALSTPLALAGSGIVYAPDWMWQFGYNMKTPVTILAVLVALLCYMTYINASRLMKGSAKVSDDYAIGEWRAWTAINTTAVMGLGWLLVQAIPAPDFKKEVVVKEVPKEVIKQVPVYKAGQKIVYKTPTFLEAFDACRVALRGAYTLRDTDEAEYCNKMAKEAALPPYRTITNTVTVRVHDDYKTLFDDCMKQWETMGEKDTATGYTQTCIAYAQGGTKQQGQ